MGCGRFTNKCAFPWPSVSDKLLTYGCRAKENPGNQLASHSTFQISTLRFCQRQITDFYTVLDAPNLRDDFYCSVLAYSPTSHTLAVGLGTMLYAWSEKQGVYLLHAGTINGAWLSSIAFSSTQGQKCILAYGRSDGTLTLMSLYDRPLPRFEVQQPCPIACLTWRPTETVRPSRSPTNLGNVVRFEDLVVGDESGNVYYYSV
jgi:hypothetical protein